MPIAKTGPMAGTHFRAGSPEMAEYIRANGGLAPGMWEPDEQDYADSAAANNASGMDPGATAQGYSDQEAAYRASPAYQARDAQRQADLASGKTPQGIDWNNQYIPVDAGNALAQAQRAGGPDYWDQFLKDQAGASGLQMPGFNTALQDQDRLQQQRVIQELQAQAAGDPNSQAQQQLQQGYQGAQAQQSSLGSTMRGQSAGAARQGIASGQQGIQRGLAGDQQMLMLQEQQAAQAALQQLLAQQYGQDVGQAQGMGQGQLQGDALNQAMQQFYLSGLVDKNLSNYQYGTNLAGTSMGLDMEEQRRRAAETSNLIRAGATAAATAANAYSGEKSSGTAQSKYRPVSSDEPVKGPDTLYT